eukprot:4521383-Ditylum_brightwellii.AAC.1
MDEIKDLNALENSKTKDIIGKYNIKDIHSIRTFNNLPISDLDTYDIISISFNGESSDLEVSLTLEKGSNSK